MWPPGAWTCRRSCPRPRPAGGRPGQSTASAPDPAKRLRRVEHHAGVDQENLPRPRHDLRRPARTDRRSPETEAQTCSQEQVAPKWACPSQVWHAQAEGAGMYPQSATQHDPGMVAAMLLRHHVAGKYEARERPNRARRASEGLAHDACVPLLPGSAFRHVNKEVGGPWPPLGRRVPLPSRSAACHGLTRRSRGRP